MGVQAARGTHLAQAGLGEAAPLGVGVSAGVHLHMSCPAGLPRVLPAAPARVQGLVSFHHFDGLLPRVDHPGPHGATGPGARAAHRVGGEAIGGILQQNSWRQAHRGEQEGEEHSLQIISVLEGEPSEGRSRACLGNPEALAMGAQAHVVSQASRRHTCGVAWT